MRPLLPPLSLRAKFIAAAVAIIVALTTVMSGLVLYEVGRSLTGEEHKRGQTLAGQLAALAEFPLRTGDHDELVRLARNALLFEDVVGVEFAAADGTVLAREGREPAKTARTIESAAPVYRTAKAFRDETDFFTGEGEPPAGEVVGRVTVRLSLVAIDRLVESIRLIIIMAACILASLSIVVSVQLARRITDPIAKLSRGVEAIGAGHLDLAIDVGENGEIGALAAHVNQMARDLKKSVDQMIQQEKMATLGRMASCITHEIGSPLNSILIDAHLVHSLLPPESEGRQAAEAIIEQARRMRDTVRNLLDYARTPEAELEPVDLAQALDEALMVLAHPLRKSGLSIERRWPADLPRVRAVKNMTVQVFVNLITNAIEAAGSGGELIIEAAEQEVERVEDSRKIAPKGARTDQDGQEVARDGKSVRVSFADHGPGISEEQAGRIFEPFYTTKASGEGTGLGLTICQHIMQGFGGSIRFEPRDPRGSIFILIFQSVTRKKP
jgi:two-component system, NtrC family, sensor kinase